MPAPELPETAGNFMSALFVAGYMFPLIGAVEVIVGLLLVFKKWVPFALIFLAPVSVNIIFFHLMLAPAGMGPGAVLAILNIALIYAYWDKYKPLFD